MSDAPLYDALIKEAQKGFLRMHMPGHKGKLPDSFAFSDIFQIDFTELGATGNLYEGLPPIADAEELMARAAGADQCFFLPGGSTQGMMAALSAACPPGGRILVDRGCHRSVFAAMAHMNLMPEYFRAPPVYPWGVPGPVGEDLIRDALDASPGVSAVVLTSPTYYGALSDIASVARAAKKRGVPLIVDEAHGAHLPYLGVKSAAAQGAALSVSSAHKTLPALTCGAYLLADKSFDPREIRRFSAMFGTSSPSYPVMASMDAARAYLLKEGGARYRRVAKQVRAMRRLINARNAFCALEDAEHLALDPCRLTVDTASGGIRGFEAANMLDREYNIICEMADARNIVMILTCADDERDILRVKDALVNLEKAARPASGSAPADPPPFPKQKMTPRQAAYAAREYLPLRRSAGRIAGQHLAPYPPGVPIVAAGEEIGKEHIDLLLSAGFERDVEIAVIG